MKRKTIVKGQSFRKAFAFEIKSVDEVNHVIRGTFSTPMQDRHGEIVDQKGWDLEEYRLNPVVLWSHDACDTPAVAQMVELGIDGDGNLAGAMKFAVDEFDFAATLFRLYAGKYMRAFSCGFRNEEYTYDQVNEIYVLTKNTLYEVSCVNIPANALSLAKQKGIDTSALEKAMDLDEDGGITMTFGVDADSVKRAEEFAAALKTFVAALDAVRDPETKKTEPTRVDVAPKEDKVETPKGTGGLQNRSARNKRAINRAVRSLLKAKRAR